MARKDLTDPSFDLIDELAAARFINWLEMTGPAGTMFRKEQASALQACLIVSAITELTASIDRVSDLLTTETPDDSD
mgnify:FL=1